uniref:Uncharacterized protein n=1 Tax=Hyaloperonospora arabidopsidis (strain Emoy2) TaxID=559515 RepID=M4BRA1_HYAAE
MSLSDKLWWLRQKNFALEPRHKCPLLHRRHFALKAVHSVAIFATTLTKNAVFVSLREKPVDIHPALRALSGPTHEAENVAEASKLEQDPRRRQVTKASEKACPH